MTKRNNRMCGLSLVVMGGVLGTQTLFAAGYEKAVIWSGKYAGMAGAGVTATGAESLFFNPAGLGGITGLEATLNGSPTIPSLNVPLNSTTTNTTSDSVMSPPVGAFVGYGVTPKLGVAIGFYTSAGGNVTYSNVDYSTFAGNAAYKNLTPTIKANFAVNEFSVGAGYEVNDWVRVGAAYRLGIFNSNLSLAVLNNLALSTVAIDNLSASASGYRLGMEVGPKKGNWGVGVQYRNSVSLSANGTSSGKMEIVYPVAPFNLTSTTPYNLTGGTATLQSTLPQQISIGGYYDVVPNTWRVLAQYDFVEYSKNQSLIFTGDKLTSSNAAVQGVISTTVGKGAIPNYPQNWRNLQDLRLGTEWTNSDWSFRGGYVYTSQVTPLYNPSPVFNVPGPSHTFVLGAGKKITSNLSANLALEYTKESATVTKGTDVSASTFPQAPADPSFPVMYGNYSLSIMAAHIGLTYAM